jgi:hypothetical protein
MIAAMTDCFPPSGCDFDQALLSNYRSLFRFGLGLTGNPETALDLTQQTVYLALKSEGQLRERGKARSWLFTILYRAFLQTRRQNPACFPHHTLNQTACELPGVERETVKRLNVARAFKALAQADEIFRLPDAARQRHTNAASERNDNKNNTRIAAAVGVGGGSPKTDQTLQSHEANESH